METTQAYFTWVNPLSGDYATVVLPKMCGTLDENNVDDRILAYDRLTMVIGENNVRYCTFSSFKHFD